MMKFPSFNGNALPVMINNGPIVRVRNYLMFVIILGNGKAFLGVQIEVYADVILVKWITNLSKQNVQNRRWYICN